MTTTWVRHLTAALFAVAAVSTGCGSTENHGSPDRGGGVPFKARVVIDDRGYNPQRIRVLVGGTVTWVNRDPDSLHTAETRDPRYHRLTGGESQAFDTHTLTWKEPHTVTFTKPGVYEYYCSLDPTMEGVVDVVVRQPERPQ